MWVDGDEGRRSNASIDGIQHEMFAKVSDDDIIKKDGGLQLGGER